MGEGWVGFTLIQTPDSNSRTPDIIDWFLIMELGYWGLELSVLIINIFLKIL